MNARSFPCAVSQDLARHEAAEERATAHAEAIDARLPALMAPGAAFYPLTGKHLAEVMAEAEPEFFDKLAAALASGDSRNPSGCHLIRKQAHDYWLPLAVEQAEADMKADRDAALESVAEMKAQSARDVEFHGFEGVG